MLFLVKDGNQILASSLKEKGKSLSLTISPSTSLYFCISQSSIKLFKCTQGELIFHNKVQQSRFNLIRRCRSSRCSNRSADKVTVVVTSKVTQLGVLTGTHSSNKQ